LREDPIFRMVDQRSVVDSVRQQLIEQLRYGKLKPGSQLPSEKDLGATMGVSRPALREAIHTLVGEGLLEIRRGHGTFVKEPTSSSAIQAEVLSLLLLPEDLQEIQDARRLIEPEIAAQAAILASDDELDALEALLDEMERIARAGESIFETAWGFHRELARVAGNKTIAKIVDILYEAIRVAERPLYDLHFDPLEDIQEHRSLLEVIKQRDANRAYQAMINHLGDVEEGLGRAIGHEGQEPPNRSGD